MLKVVLLSIIYNHSYAYVVSFYINNPNSTGNFVELVQNSFTWMAMLKISKLAAKH